MSRFSAQRARFQPFVYDELFISGTNHRGAAVLFWLDESLEESANVNAPEVIAAEIVADLEVSLEHFAVIAQDLETCRPGYAGASKPRPLALHRVARLH